MRRIESREADNGHIWVVVTCATDIDDEADPFVTETVSSFREAYGVSEIAAMAEEPDSAVAERFDVTAIKRAINRGLPEAAREGNRRAQLANYRSEPAEIVARDVLRIVFSVEFPASPQRGKGNVNQPVLGFDGWGFLRRPDGSVVLVLVQVKGTEHAACPPAVANDLADECKRAPRDLDTICHALSVIALFVKGTEYLTIALGMLEALGQDRLPPMAVGPVIVRGAGTAHIEDLRPVRNIMPEIAPVIGRGATVSLGCDLGIFGMTVLERARNTV